MDKTNQNNRQNRIDKVKILKKKSSNNKLKNKSRQMEVGDNVEIVQKIKRTPKQKSNNNKKRNQTNSQRYRL